MWPSYAVIISSGRRAYRNVSLSKEYPPENVLQAPILGGEKGRRFVSRNGRYKKEHLEKNISSPTAPLQTAVSVNVNTKVRKWAASRALKQYCSLVE